MFKSVFLQMLTTELLLISLKYYEPLSKKIRYHFGVNGFEYCAIFLYAKAQQRRRH